MTSQGEILSMNGSDAPHAACWMQPPALDIRARPSPWPKFSFELLCRAMYYKKARRIRQFLRLVLTPRSLRA